MFRIYRCHPVHTLLERNWETETPHPLGVIPTLNILQTPAVSLRTVRNSLKCWIITVRKELRNYQYFPLVPHCRAHYPESVNNHYTLLKAVVKKVQNAHSPQLQVWVATTQTNAIGSVPNVTLGGTGIRLYTRNGDIIHVFCQLTCCHIHIQGGSDKSGTLSKLHRCIKKSYFLLIISHKTVLALFRSGN